LVDDEPDVLTMLDRVLSLGGCDVAAKASDAHSAIDLTIDLRADVAVVDYALPDGDGIAVAEAIKSKSRDTYVILFSAQPVGAIALENPAVDRFLSKVEVSRLSDVLEEIARERGLAV